ncbi:MAG: copper chaperone PCu(A)C [Proteobacteria bacterium]|nr:copper chaperone PCu(A)C [Pseudomonadota bacterium]
MKKMLVLAAFALAACGVGGGPQTQSLHVENGWATPTPGGVNVSAGYVTLVNDSDTADALIAANSTRAANVDLHEMNMSGAIMQMRSVASVQVPAHGSVTLEPGGTHLMFNGVATPFAEGERIPVQLTFEHAGVVSVDLPVSRAAPEHQH